MWGLSMTAWATKRAAASVISPNDRLSSWRRRTYQSRVISLSSDTCRHKKLKFAGELTLRIGSPSLRTAVRATAPSERTRQSPKLITRTFLRCLRACMADRRKQCTETFWVKHTGYISALLTGSELASPAPWPAFPSWWRCCRWSWGRGALGCVAWLKLTPSHLRSWYHSGACGLPPGCPSASMEKQRRFNRLAFEGPVTKCKWRALSNSNYSCVYKYYWCEALTASEKKSSINKNLSINLGVSVLYLKGLGQGAGSFIFQAVPPCDEHSQFEWSSKRWWLSVALNQSFSQDLNKPYSTVTACTGMQKYSNLSCVQYFCSGLL